MRLFLQINIGNPRDNSSEQSLLHFASSLSNDLIGADIDGDSDPVVIDLVLKLIGQVDEALIMVHVNESWKPLNGAARVLSALSDYPGMILLVYGDHQEVEKIIEGLDVKLTRVKKEEEVRKLIADFAQ